MEIPIFNRKVRLERREKIKNIILEFQKSKDRRLKKNLYKEILNYLLSHHDYTGGHETPLLETAEGVAEWYGITRRTVERWKQKREFPFLGKVFDCWAIDFWLRKYGKVRDDFEIIKTKKFKT